MNKKVLLPITKTPSLKSYTHNCYNTAIMESEENCGEIAAIMYIKNRKNYKWDFCSETMNLVWDKNIAYIHSDVYAINKGCHCLRECDKCDELIVEIRQVQYNSPDAIINLVYDYPDIKLDTEQKSIFKIGLIMKKGILITENDDLPLLEEWSENFPLWLKLKIDQNNICAYYSYDSISWNLLYKTENKCDFKEEKPRIGFDMNLLENQYYNWKYSNYIQLIYDKNSGVKYDYYLSPRRDARNYNLHQFLEYTFIRISEYEDLFGDIINTVKLALNYNKYCVVFLDEYYLPQGEFFQQHHYIHQNLIYGFDDEEKSFNILGYGKNRRVITTEISYSMFLEACKEIKKGEKIEFIKYSPNLENFKFDMDSILRQIFEYVNGINTSIYTNNIISTQEGVYGLNTYSYINNKEKTRLFSDQRIAYLIFEHNEIMYNRLKFIAQKIKFQKHINIDKYIIKFNEINKQSKKILGLVLKNYFTDDYEVQKNTTKELQDLEKNERVFYLEFLDEFKYKY